MTVSVIIPVARRDLLQTCRRSVDESIAYCDTNIDWDVVEIFDDEHKGVSWARNEGLKRAVGEWVAWVDCDDVVEKRWASAIASQLMNMVESSAQYDVLVYGVNSIRNGRKSAIRMCASNIIMEPFDFLRSCLLDKTGSTWLWNKVFRCTLFDGLEFKGQTQEDFRLMPRLFCRAKGVAVMPDLLYEYRRPAGSLTHKGGGHINAEGIIEAINDDLDDVQNATVLLKIWKEGCALRAADWLYHSGYDSTLHRFLLKNIHRVIFDGNQSIRIKIKCIIALLMYHKR